MNNDLWRKNLCKERKTEKYRKEKRNKGERKKETSKTEYVENKIDLDATPDVPIRFGFLVRIERERPRPRASRLISGREKMRVGRLGTIWNARSERFERGREGPTFSLTSRSVTHANLIIHRSDMWNITWSSCQVYHTRDRPCFTYHLSLLEPEWSIRVHAVVHSALHVATTRTQRDTMQSYDSRERKRKAKGSETNERTNRNRVLSKERVNCIF